MYVDRDKGQIGFDPHKDGVVKLSKTTLTSAGLQQAFIAAGGDTSKAGSYPLEPCDLTPVRFRVNVPRKEGKRKD